jgi:tetratricopeptide (TPR) repeat protein
MKNLIYIFTFILATTAIAQNTTSIAFEKQKLQQAKAYGDESIVANVMYSLIALEGPQSSYKDSLAYVYFNKRNYVSCFLVTNDLLKTKPKNLELLEMNAVSLESMGALEKSKEAYEKLFAMTNDNYHAYKLAGIEFRMNQNEGAYATIKKAGQISGNEGLKITFQVNENYNQNVELKAAIAYLEGLIAVSLNKSVEAKASFERAIQIFPDFVLAKSKLEILNAKQTEKK